MLSRRATSIHFRNSASVVPASAAALFRPATVRASPAPFSSYVSAPRWPSIYMSPQTYRRSSKKTNRRVGARRAHSSAAVVVGPDSLEPIGVNYEKHRARVLRARDEPLEKKFLESLRFFIQKTADPKVHLHQVPRQSPNATDRGGFRCGPKSKNKNDFF